MDPTGDASICHALTQDTLEEVASHCSTASLLSLQQTCSTFQQLLARSERVWFRRLAEDCGLHLKALPSHDAMFIKLARTVYEASRTTKLRFQGTLVTGGVDEDAMKYWVDNMFKPDKAPYCSNCSFNADCLALLLDGEVPRDAEYGRVRGYIVRRCRYAAALIMNVQLPQQDRDPDAVMDILEDWTDEQLESFFRDLVAALNQGHALGRLLVYDVEHDRIPSEQQRILAVERYLSDRLKLMKRGMLKSPLRPNTIMDTSVLDKIADPAKWAMAGVVHELTLSRAGNLTCPVSSGVVLLGHMDFTQLRGLPPEQVLQELEAATQDPVCIAFNFLSTPEQVEAAAAGGCIPPIAVTDQTLAGIWHEFVTSDAQSGKGHSTAGAPPPAAAATIASSRAGQPTTSASPGPPAARMNGRAAQPAAGAGPNGAAVGPGAVAGEAAMPPAAGAGNAAAARPQPRAMHPPFAADAAPSSATPLQGRLVRWRPLLWFHFNRYPECVEFVRSNHSLLAATAPLYSSVTVRHRGPPSTQPGTLHLPTVWAQQAAVAARRAAQEAQQSSASGLQQQQQQQQQMLSFLQQAGPTRMVMPPGHPAFLGPQHHPLQLLQHQQQRAAALAGAPAPGAHHLRVPAQEQGTQEQGAQQQGAQQQHGAATGAQGSEGGEVEYSQGSLMSQDTGGSSSSGAMLEVGESESEGDYEDLGEGNEEDGGAAGGPPAAPPLAAAPGAGAAAENEEDAGSEGGSDDEEQHEQHVAAFYQAVAAVAVQAAGGGAGPAAAADPLARPSLGLVSKDSTKGRRELHVRLSRPAAGNVLLVKLISQENMMHLFRDQHDWPNVDMAYVGLMGKAVTLPPGVSLQL